MNPYFWNNLDLPTPVVLSTPLNCSKPYVAVSRLRSVMCSIKKTLNDLKQLNLEAAALSRVIYRTKYKLRQEKSFKTLQMINRCLTNYLSIHFPNTINTLLDTLSDDCGPSRQMMEWGLARMISVAHLFRRVQSLCVSAAGHLIVRVKLAQMHEVSFFAVAVVSRIWTLAQFMVGRACEWYSSLYQYLDKLQPSPHPWLPENAVLPPNLDSLCLGLKAGCKPDELLSQTDASASDTDKAQINENFSTVLDLEDIGETVARNAVKKSSTIEEEIEELSRKVFRINENTKLKRRKSQKVNDKKLSKKQRVNTQGSSSPLILQTEEVQINGDHSTIIDLDEVEEAVQRNSTEKNSIFEEEVEEFSWKASRTNKNATGKNKKAKNNNNKVLSKKRGLKTEESVQKNHNTTKTNNNCNLVPKPSRSSYKHSIKAIRSSEDLLKFLEVESAFRKSSSSAEKSHQQIMKNCDKLQWSMIERFMKKQIKLLSRSEASGNLEQQKKLLKRVQKNIKSLVS